MPHLRPTAASWSTPIAIASELALLRLTAGALVFGVAAWLFGGAMQGVPSGNPLGVLDLQVERWFHVHQAPWVTVFASAVSRWHEWPAVTGATLLFIGYLLWQRQWLWVATVVCTVPGGMLLNSLLKLEFHRARPTLSELAAGMHSFSFPSGHVMAAALLYGVAAAYLVAISGARPWRIATVPAAAFLVALVAFSRVYLGVHYLSDVLAAAAAGAAWVALCQLAVNALWPGRGQRN